MWKAEATEAGRHFAEHGCYPVGHWTNTSDTTRAKSATISPPARPTIPARAERKVTALRPVDQMIADIVAAGGSLEVEDFHNYYDNLVSSAIRHGKVPEGKLLETERRSWPQRVLQLVDKPAWMTAVLEPIEVSDRSPRQPVRCRRRSRVRWTDRGGPVRSAQSHPVPLCRRQCALRPA